MAGNAFDYKHLRTVADLVAGVMVLTPAAPKGVTSAEALTATGWKFSGRS